MKRIISLCLLLFVGFSYAEDQKDNQQQDQPSVEEQLKSLLEQEPDKKVRDCCAQISLIFFACADLDDKIEKLFHLKLSVENWVMYEAAYVKARFSPYEINRCMGLSLEPITIACVDQGRNNECRKILEHYVSATWYKQFKNSEKILKERLFNE